MSTTYGNAVALSGSTSAYWKAGIRFSQSPTRVTSSTGLVTVKAELLFRTHLMRVQDPKVRISWSGSFGSGSQDINLNYYPSTYIPWTQSTPVVVKTLTRTVTASEARAITSSLTFSMSGINAAPGTGRVSSSWTTDKKPVTILAPNPPTGVSAVNRTGGGIRITWTRAATTTAPYVTQYLQRWDAATGDWSQIARLSATATYYDDNSTFMGNRYRYRLYAQNTAGNSGYANSEFIYTAPYPPTNVTASKSDSNIVLAWDPPEVFPSNLYAPVYEVVWQEDGGGWEYDEGVTTSAGQTSWTHVSPDPTVTYRYAVRTLGPNTGTGDSSSTYAHSHDSGDGIRLNAPPLAPTNLTPTEGFAAGTTIAIGWRHRPQDGSAQLSAEVRYRAEGTTAWTTRTVIGTASTLSIGTLAPETTYEYQVRTRGAHPDWSPWASSSFGVSQRPSVTINETRRETWGESNRLGVRWTYTDPAGDVSSRYDSVLTDLTTGEVVDKRDSIAFRQSSGSTTGLTYDVVDGHTYEFRVRLADSWGVYSDWAVASVLVDYAEPPTPVIESAEFDADTGTVAVTATVPTGGTPPADTIELYRHVGGGQFEMVASGPAPRLEWTDWTPNYGVGTHNLYVARSVSAYPSYSLSQIALAYAAPRGCEEWLWLSSATSPEVRVRLRGNPAVDSSRERVTALERHYGATHPTEYGTTMIDHTLAVRGELDRRASSTWRQWEAIVEELGDLVYRDPWGRNEHVSLGPVQTRHGLPGWEAMSFDLTVVEHEHGSPGLPLYPGQDLEERGVNLYELVEGEGIDLTENGHGLYLLERDPDVRMALVERGENLYALVYLDAPVVVYP